MGKFQICCLTTILFCGIFTVSWCELPKDITKCKSTNNEECVRKAIEDLFRLYPRGSPESGMIDIAALNITNLKVSKPNSNSPIQINFEFLKCTIFGVEKANILRTVGFDKEMKNAELNALIPKLILNGDYVMGGKILLLPINGKGKGDIELRDVNFTFRTKMIKEQRGNKTFFKIKKFRVSIVPKLTIFRLDNLFNGNEVLSKTLNEVLNENWKDVWTELQNGINQAMERILGNVMDEIYANLSLDDLYAD